MKSNLSEGLIKYVLLPMVGAGCVILLWGIASSGDNFDFTYPRLAAFFVPN